MCLRLSKINRETHEPKIATKDLVCYKLVLDSRNRNIGSLITPYRNEPISIGSTYTSEFTYNSDGNVESGLHSYKSLRGVKFDRLNYFDSSIIVRCCIPKGSRYYQGKFSNKQCYASDTLTYVELIKIN